MLRGKTIALNASMIKEVMFEISNLDFKNLKSNKNLESNKKFKPKASRREKIIKIKPKINKIKQ